MRRKRLLVAGLALAAALVAGVAVWLGSQSPLERYITPPLEGTKYRVSALVPRGWAKDRNNSDESRGYVLLTPPKPPGWIPRWLKRGPFREPSPENFLVLTIHQDPFRDNAEGFVDRSPQGWGYVQRLKDGPGFYGVYYSRSTKRDFETTRLDIYDSLRLVE